jgi:hypothetical protein
MRQIALVFVLLILLSPAACTAREGFTIEGTVVDAETGKEVSREGMYLHFFCDEIDHQETLESARTASYEISMPKSTVRIRAFDTSKRYHLFEKTVQVEGDELQFDIAVVPTHYILLTGKIVDLNTGKRILP